MYGRPKPTPPARVPPGAAVTAAEVADLPFGGHVGEWLSGGHAAAAPPPPQPLVIEPPPWAGQEGDASLGPGPAPDPGPPLDAFSALKADEPFEPPPLSLEPPVVLEPLQRPALRLGAIEGAKVVDLDEHRRAARSGAGAHIGAPSRRPNWA
jgi:hypothetical protein